MTHHRLGITPLAYLGTLVAVFLFAALPSHAGTGSQRHWLQCMDALAHTQNEAYFRLGLIEQTVEEYTDKYLAASETGLYRGSDIRFSRLAGDLAQQEKLLRNVLNIITYHEEPREHLSDIVDPARNHSFLGLTAAGRMFTLTLPRTRFYPDTQTVAASFHRAPQSYRISIDVDNPAHAREVLSRIKHGLNIATRADLGRLSFIPRPLLDDYELSQKRHTAVVDPLTVSLVATTNGSGEMNYRLRLAFTNTTQPADAALKYIAKLIRYFNLQLLSTTH